MNKPNSVVISAIISLVIMQIAAMHYEINGTFRMIVAAAIAGLAGWKIPHGN